MSDKDFAPNAPEGPIAPPPSKTREEDPAHPDPDPDAGRAPGTPAPTTPGSAEGGRGDDRTG